MRSSRALIPMLLSLLSICGSLVADERSPALKDRAVLVVSPQAADGPAGWIRDLLAKHGARVAVAGWKDATVEKAHKHDLIVIAGRGRRIGNEAVFGYDRPVLGVGSLGHAYFGRLHLKHGYPYS